MYLFSNRQETSCIGRVIYFYIRHADFKQVWFKATTHRGVAAAGVLDLSRHGNDNKYVSNVVEQLQFD